MSETVIRNIESIRLFSGKRINNNNSATSLWVYTWKKGLSSVTPRTRYSDLLQEPWSQTTATGFRSMREMASKTRNSRGRKEEAEAAFSLK